MTDNAAPVSTDTPIATPTFPPPSKLDQIKAFVGDLARPYAIIITATATGWAIISTGVDVAKLTAAGLILGGLYGAKSLEVSSQTKHSAQVEIAKVGATS